VPCVQWHKDCSGTVPIWISQNYQRNIHLIFIT
jgi:hypothetical protein